MWLFLVVLFLEYKNIQLGFGTQYLLGHYFQPCVFGVFIQLSIERFLAGKSLWASAWLALAAAFHPACIPSTLLIQGSYTAVTLYRQKKNNRRIPSAAAALHLAFGSSGDPLQTAFRTHLPGDRG